MNDHPQQLDCPHCGTTLQAFELPDNTGWQTGFQLACFNDECPYFLRGWKHMEEHYAVKASYRFRINPETGAASPLAVWSPSALKDRILDAEISIDDSASAVSSAANDDDSQKGSSA